MSGRSRRARRKISLLLKMEAQRMRCARDMRALVYCGMYPLGRRLARMGLKARAVKALRAIGSTIEGL